MPIQDHAIVRPQAAHLASLLALNNRNAADLSWLEPAGLDTLLAEAFHARVAVDDGADVAALLIAFDQDADYQSPNFLWFRDRYPRFVYVDRIAVSERARGLGLARRLYGGLFADAQAAGHRTITCEVNEEPPNPASHAFHAALGFVAVGTAALGAGKRARYYACGVGA